MPEPNPGTFLSADAADRTEAAVLAYERALRQPPDLGNSRGLQMRPPLRGILLEDLADGGTADVAVTLFSPNTFQQKISIVGDVTGGKFALAFPPPSGLPQTTDSIPFNATAAQMQSVLAALPAIGAGNVQVQLGKETITDVDGDGDKNNQETVSPAVWIVQFVGTFLQGANPQPPPLLTQGSTALTFGTFGGLVTAATDNWIDSGVVEQVRAVVPVGSPTPMRQGAVVIGLWMPGVGYGVISCEARVYSQTYYY